MLAPISRQNKNIITTTTTTNTYYTTCNDMLQQHSRCGNTAKALDYLTTNVATPPWKSRYSATRRLVDERQSPQEALPIEPTNVLKKTTHRQTRRTEMHTLPHPITP